MRGGVDREWKSTKKIQFGYGVGDIRGLVVETKYINIYITGTSQGPAQPDTQDPISPMFVCGDILTEISQEIPPVPGHSQTSALHSQDRRDLSWLKHYR